MNKIFNLSQGHFLGLCKQKIPLDCIFLIEQMVNKEDVNQEEFLPFLQRLQRKGYIDGKGQLTKYGEELYQSLFGEVVAVKAKKPIEKNTDFDRWWNAYPATDDFEINGRHFKGTQRKRIKEDQCRVLFAAHCNSFTANDIIDATIYHFNSAMEQSFKKKENQLTYIPNSERYLREKYFEPYIEKARKKMTEIKAKTDFEI